jgi:hypothetical protein
VLPAHGCLTNGSPSLAPPFPHTCDPEYSYHTHTQSAPPAPPNTSNTHTRSAPPNYTGPAARGHGGAAGHRGRRRRAARRPLLAAVGVGGAWLLNPRLRCVSLPHRAPPVPPARVLKPPRLLLLLFWGVAGAGQSYARQGALQPRLSGHLSSGPVPVANQAAHTARAPLTLPSCLQPPPPSPIPPAHAQLLLPPPPFVLPAACTPSTACALCSRTLTWRWRPPPTWPPACRPPCWAWGRRSGRWGPAGGEGGGGGLCFCNVCCCVRVLGSSAWGQRGPVATTQIVVCFTPPIPAPPPPGPQRRLSVLHRAAGAPAGLPQRRGQGALCCPPPAHSLPPGWLAGCPARRLPATLRQQKRARSLEGRSVPEAPTRSAQGTQQQQLRRQAAVPCVSSACTLQCSRRPFCDPPPPPPHTPFFCR